MAVTENEKFQASHRKTRALKRRQGLRNGVGIYHCRDESQCSK